MKNILFTFSPLLEETACSLPENSLFPGHVSEMFISSSLGAQGKGLFLGDSAYFPQAASRKGWGLSPNAFWLARWLPSGQAMGSFWDP